MLMTGYVRPEEKQCGNGYSKLVKSEKVAITVRQVNLSYAMPIQDLMQLKNKIDILLMQEPYTSRDRVAALGQDIRVVQVRYGTP